MKEISMVDLRKLINFEQVVDLDENKECLPYEGEKVYLGRLDLNIAYDENLAY